MLLSFSVPLRPLTSSPALPLQSPRNTAVSLLHSHVHLLSAHRVWYYAQGSEPRSSQKETRASTEKIS